MSKKQTRKARRAIVHAAGGVGELVKEFGVTRQAVEKWVAFGFPADPERVRRISELSGHTPGEINPERYGWLDNPKTPQTCAGEA